MLTPQDSYFDTHHIWHPYSKMKGAPANPIVVSAESCQLTLSDGNKVVDGMASWWAAIHGYNHPHINAAATEQLSKFSHVMFGGLTHEPAIRLAQRLVTITPEPLNHVFFSDSGSVAVEVAMKMAIQYWYAKGNRKKQQFLTFRRGYHGDTFATMALSDPDNGMHQLFGDSIQRPVFVEEPPICKDIDEEFIDQGYLERVAQCFEMHAEHVAAIVIEPIVQGAGGMRVYHPEIVRQIKALCDKHNVLLVLDEIATGFGRTGDLFAFKIAQVTPDILCLGKALTGGYLTLAATLASTEIADAISENEPYAFMHGPTFMANPLACSIADASIGLLLELGYRNKVSQINKWLVKHLSPLQDKFEDIVDIRIIGAIGIVEVKDMIDVPKACAQLIQNGVWLRPYLNLFYTMPPFVVSELEIQKIANAINNVLRQQDYRKIL